MRNDLIKQVVSRRLVTLVCPYREEEAESPSTLTSRDENLCFMLVIEFAQTLKRIYLKLGVKLQLGRRGALWPRGSCDDISMGITWPGITHNGKEPEPRWAL